MDKEEISKMMERILSYYEYSIKRSFNLNDWGDNGLEAGGFIMVDGIIFEVEDLMRRIEAE